MFTEFLISLRRRGVPVGLQEWLALHQALGKGLVGNLDDMYGIGRAVLVHREGHYDAYDLAFAEVFRGGAGPATVDLKAALQKWLEDPARLEHLSPELFEKLTGLSLEELRKRFEEMLREQKERHDGGNRFIGTGGTSPFGTGGAHPTGMRVGEGGGRTAVQVAESRRFRNYRTDVTLDVRQFKQALRMLRSLGREGVEVLDLEETIGETCRNAGDIELVYRPERKNTVKLLLLMDAGGSMDPHARLVDRMFSAASDAGHWKRFGHHFFHNMVYDKVYTDILRRRSILTAKLFDEHPPDTRVVFVGDACMAPWELTLTGASIDWWDRSSRSPETTGVDWLLRFRRHFHATAWLNPEPERFWRHPTIHLISRIIPMFPLTLNGLSDAIKHLRKPRPSNPRLPHLPISG